MKLSRPIKIGLAIIAVLVVLHIIKCYRNRGKKGMWTEHQKKIVDATLRAKPLFKCAQNYPKIVDCLIDTIFVKYDPPNGLRIANGGITPVDIDVLMPCLNSDCLAEMFVIDHPNASDSCARCVTMKAVNEANGDMKGAGVLLHDDVKVAGYMAACTTEGCIVPNVVPVTPAPAPAPAPAPPVVENLLMDRKIKARVYY